MTSLPVSNSALLVRTDYADDAEWQRLRDEVAVPSEDGFTADLELVDDRSFAHTTWEQVKAAVPPNEEGSTIVLVAAAPTFARADHAVLVVDLMDYNGQRLEPFRCIPTELWSVENNLNLANMDWDDFANATNQDRTFRGF